MFLFVCLFCNQWFSIFFNKFIYLFIFGCVGSSLLPAGFSLVAASGGYSLLRCAGFSLQWLLIAVASLIAKHRLQACRLQQLWHTGSVVVAHGLQSADSAVVVHGLSCSAACGIFLDQSSNPCPPALADRFLTSVPPGKPPILHFEWIFYPSMIL